MFYWPGRTQIISCHFYNTRGILRARLLAYDNQFKQTEALGRFLAVVN